MKRARLKRNDLNTHTCVDTNRATLIFYIVIYRLREFRRLRVYFMRQKECFRPAAAAARRCSYEPCINNTMFTYLSMRTMNRLHGLRAFPKRPFVLTNVSDTWVGGRLKCLMNLHNLSITIICSCFINSKIIVQPYILRRLNIFLRGISPSSPLLLAPMPNTRLRKTNNLKKKMFLNTFLSTWTVRYVMYNDRAIAHRSESRNKNKTVSTTLNCVRIRIHAVTPKPV